MSYAKGARIEREIKALFEQAGFQVVRSAGSHTDTDLYIYNKEIGISLEVQVKARKSLQVYAWLSSADALVLKADRKEPLIVMPLKTFLEVVKWRQR